MLVFKNRKFKAEVSVLRGDPSLFSFFIFIIIIILFGFVIRFGVFEIYKQRKMLADLKRTKAILASKEKFLTQVESDTIGIFYDSVVSALPTENQVLFSLLNIRSLLNFYMLPLEEYDINLGGESQDNSFVGTATIKVNVVGEFDQVISFIKDAEKLSPLVLVNKLSFSKKENLINAEITFNSFWSPFELKRPPIDMPLQPLSDTEKEMMVKLSELKRNNTTALFPSEPSDRSDPFSKP
jgi:Tfp pilus assembly protein PilO